MKYFWLWSISIVTVLWCIHALRLSCCHVVMQSWCHVVMLLCHIVILRMLKLSCCHFVIFTHIVILVMLSCWYCRSVMLSYLHTVLPCSPVVVLSWCNNEGIFYVMVYGDVMFSIHVVIFTVSSFMCHGPSWSPVILCRECHSHWHYLLSVSSNSSTAVCLY